MIRSFSLLALFLLPFCTLSAQLNMSLRSQIEYDQDLNDIWGWVDNDGTEYAIVGARNGTSIVSLADPDNAEELFFIPGQASTWRDIKTWGDFAYVTCDQGGTTEGLLVIDLSELPNDISYFNWTPDLPGLGTLETCHNLYIDEFGYCYLAGCNLNNGGMLIIDVFSIPGTPQFVSAAPSVYSHDVYVRDNLMYSAEINVGVFSIYDVSDKQDITSLANQGTPSSFTHNLWLSDDSNTIFTTDEVANAPVASYDISDFGDIEELDQYRPLETLGANVIPHNVHVWNDYLIISYYTDGGIVVDAARPENLIEVGNFDTFFGGDGGFSGAWGAYPFLPSGLVLISDINSGLYVLEADYKRACYLEGTVTDAVSGLDLPQVEVEILSDDLNMASTDLNGRYQTGQVTAGSFDVRFFLEGYETLIVEDVALDNGELVILDVELVPFPTYNGTVISAETGEPVPGAGVFFTGLYSDLLQADGSGDFSAPLGEGTYTFVAGSWGYAYKEVEIAIPVAGPIVIELEKGYEDDFIFDYEWSTSASTNVGLWEWGEPNISNFGPAISQPDFDIDDDYGDFCYVTGNSGTGGMNDVDDGVVRLTSPVMDLSTYTDPIVKYHTFFFNDGGFSTPDDELIIKINNGIETVELEVIDESGSTWRPESSFHLADFITITNNMRLEVETADGSGSGNIVEAAFDGFAIVEGSPISSVEDMNRPEMSAFPNPFAEDFRFDFNLSQQGTLVVTNAQGQVVERQDVPAGNQTLRLGHNWPKGFYFITLTKQSGGQQTLKVVKS